MGFYTRTTSNSSFYSSSSSEPNMRQELIDMFEGTFKEIPKAQTFLIRKMQKDPSTNKLIPCKCVDIVTKEPDKDRFCPFCFGEGYYWDESEIEGYRTIEGADRLIATRDRSAGGAGLLNIPLVVFYLRYDAEIKNYDKIITIDTDIEGAAVIPKKRTGVYRIEGLWDYRSDRGKLEYFKVYTHLEMVKFLNSPTYGEV